MSIEHFETIRILILGFQLGSLKEKWHMNVIPTKRYKVYYREGSGASSQRLQTVWSLCLKLSLQSSPHHFHSICTNRPLFLVVQVDVILNSRLWSCANPIPELQHTLLPPKCYKLGNVPQLYSSFAISL